MAPIPYNRVNRDNEKRYISLEAKYKDNPDYQLQFAKKEDKADFSSIAFSIKAIFFLWRTPLTITQTTTPQSILPFVLMPACSTPDSNVGTSCMHMKRLMLTRQSLSLI